MAVGLSHSPVGNAETYVRRPNTTPGQPVTLPVPTWGWHGTVYVTVSICPTVDDFCSGGYQYTRTVTQAPADAVTADLEVPANPVFVPEEDSFVTLHNPGGGKLYLVPTDTGEITAGQRTEITWRDPREAVALQAARCPTGFRPNQPTDINATRCEFFDLHRSVAAIEDVAFTAYPLHHKVITDPNAPEGTSLKVYAKGYNDVTQALSYELEDSSGTTVAGPVTWAPSYDPAGLYDPPAVLDFDPTAAAGHQLPDGDYTLNITTTVTKGGLTKSDTEPIALQLADNPPPDDLGRFELESAQRDVRGTTPATVSVQGWHDPEISGTLHVRNASGTEVWQQRVGPDCRGDLCQGDTSPGSPAWYDFRWPGKTTAGKALPVGTYRASMTVNDHWGRTVNAVDVGSLYITHLANRTKTVRYVPADSRWISNTVGRCSSAPSPGPHRWAGSVAILSLSRCASRAGTSDNAFQSFTLGLREPGQVQGAPLSGGGLRCADPRSSEGLDRLPGEQRQVGTQGRPVRATWLAHRPRPDPRCQSGDRDVVPDPRAGTGERRQQVGPQVLAGHLDLPSLGQVTRAPVRR